MEQEKEMVEKTTMNNRVNASVPYLPFVACEEPPVLDSFNNLQIYVLLDHRLNKLN